MIGACSVVEGMTAIFKRPINRDMLGSMMSQRKEPLLIIIDWF